jgi:hypothetical protein
MRRSDFVTNEMAIEVLKKENETLSRNTPGNPIYDRAMIQIKANNVAIQALEKQVLKKVETETINKGIDVSGEYDIESRMLCPNCKKSVGDYEADELYFNYCPTCGQRLKAPQE